MLRKSLPASVLSGRGAWSRNKICSAAKNDSGRPPCGDHRPWLCRCRLMVSAMSASVKPLGGLVHVNNLPCVSDGNKLLHEMLGLPHHNETEGLQGARVKNGLDSRTEGGPVPSAGQQKLGPGYSAFLLRHHIQGRKLEFDIVQTVVKRVEIAYYNTPDQLWVCRGVQEVRGWENTRSAAGVGPGLRPRVPDVHHGRIRTHEYQKCTSTFGLHS